MNSIEDYLLHPLYQYDKVKVNYLKSILPLIIIVHHSNSLPWGDAAMFLFFAMSGYGLVYSYLHKKNYLDGFLPKSLIKLFLPYLLVLIAFIVYYWIEGIDQVELFRAKGVLAFVPTTWFIYVMALFYFFFYFVFRFARASDLMKVILVGMLVCFYYLISYLLDAPVFRYSRSPGFIIGMFFALYNDYIRSHFVKWQIMLVLGVMLLLFLLFKYPVASVFRHSFVFYYLFTIAFFLLMYVIRDVKETGITKYLSSISLEMWLVQFLPIYIVTNDMHLTGLPRVLLIIVFDILLASLLHKTVEPLKTRLIEIKWPG